MLRGEAKSVIQFLPASRVVLRFMDFLLTDKDYFIIKQKCVKSLIYFLRRFPNLRSLSSSGYRSMNCCLSDALICMLKFFFFLIFFDASSTFRRGPLPC